MAVYTSEFDDIQWGTPIWKIQHGTPHADKITTQLETGLEMLETPADVQEQLEQIYMQREIRRLDEQLAFLHRQMFWMNVFQWGTYAIAVLAASILLMEFMSSR